MVQHIFFRDVRFLLFQFPLKHRCQTLFEITHEYFAALTGEDPPDIPAAVPNRVGEDSSLQKLIRMVEDAEKNQAPTQRIADRWASWLVPVALMIAIVSYIVTKDIVRAVTVMVVFCPCALVLATPTAIMAAIGQAAKNGVIIKSGEALEKMGKVDTIAFDKTGTLTYGKLEVSDIIPLAGVSEIELLALAAAAESRSEHPLGRAITGKASSVGAALPPAEDFRMKAGKGISAHIDGVRYFFGNDNYIREIGITADDDTAVILDRLRGEGKASVLISDGTKMTGIIALSDTIRPEAADMIKRLGEMGSDIAVDAADVALMDDSTSRLPYLKWLSNTTISSIRGAITLSMCINFTAVTLSVLGVLTPTAGALVHNAGSCFVVLLAALLYDRKYK